MEDETIEVTAYSGYRGEERPRAFFIKGEKIGVTELLAAWVEEGPRGGQRRRVFRLKGTDGHTHILYYDEDRGKWGHRPIF
jgi:hypothetical protein